MLKLSSQGHVTMINMFSDNLMQANPSKFQCILFGSTEKESLQLSESITLDVVGCVKLLGVDIDKKLSASIELVFVKRQENTVMF